MDNLVNYSYIEKEGNKYLGLKGEYENLTDLILTEIFEFCGCGRPEDVIDMLFKLLTLLNDNLLDSSGKWSEDKYNTHRDNVNGLISNCGARYFIYYWLDQNGFTEHGGSVPGWLTDLGKELLILLKGADEENKKQGT